MARSPWRRGRHDLAAPIAAAMDAMADEAAGVLAEFQRVLGHLFFSQAETISFVHAPGAPLRVCVRNESADHTAWIDPENGDIRVYREIGGRYDFATFADDGSVEWEPVAPAGEPEHN